MIDNKCKDCGGKYGKWEYCVTHDNKAIEVRICKKCGKSQARYIEVVK